MSDSNFDFSNPYDLVISIFGRFLKNRNYSRPRSKRIFFQGKVNLDSALASLLLAFTVMVSRMLLLVLMMVLSYQRGTDAALTVEQALAQVRLNHPGADGERQTQLVMALFAADQAAGSPTLYGAATISPQNGADIEEQTRRAHEADATAQETQRNTREVTRLEALLAAARTRQAAVVVRGAVPAPAAATPAATATPEHALVLRVTACITDPDCRGTSTTGRMQVISARHPSS